MTMDITWNITVSVPQLDHLNTLMEVLVETVQTIKDTVIALMNNQADAATALNEQVTRIADEIAQYNAESITQEQLDNLGTALRQAAADAASQAATIRSNTEEITGIVPDAPPA